MCWSGPTRTLRNGCNLRRLCHQPFLARANCFMQPDARRRSDTRSWFEKAHKDLRCAQIDLAADPPALEDALYHCQQAAEKVLKAFLVWHDQPFPKTHDLGKLGNQAVGVDRTLEPLI